MLYTLNLNENNYVLSIANTPNDNFELDLETLELDYLNAYQKVDDKLVLDINKKNEIIAQQEERTKQERINELKSYLNETDYIYAKCTETGEDVNVLYADVIEKRKEARKEIQELEGGNA